VKLACSACCVFGVRCRFYFNNRVEGKTMKYRKIAIWRVFLSKTNCFFTMIASTRPLYPLLDPHESPARYNYPPKFPQLQSVTSRYMCIELRANSSAPLLPGVLASTVRILPGFLIRINSSNQTTCAGWTPPWEGSSVFTACQLRVAGTHCLHIA
jgi:hypothetical protein